MPKLVIASRNQDKIKEIKALLSELPIDIVSSYEILPDFDVVEDKDTIMGNAAKKALETSIATGMHCLADDTGLFIEALQGAPGVYAARYAGEGCTYADNRIKALSEMGDIEDRRASFKTAVVFANPEGVIAVREGNVTGTLTKAERGTNGFGYDAIFEVEGTGKTYAEMTDAQKNVCSHRARALQAILPFLLEYFR